MITCPVCGFENPEGARFCNNCGSPLAAAKQKEGERRIATVLFADVAGSTSHAETMDPEDWAEVMNGAFSVMNAAVSQYGGTVGRLMGDAILAFFGAPVAHEDDPERAVRAGLTMQEAARAYAAEVEDRFGIGFSVRVGIHTGMSVLGFVGDEVRAEYTAMGDTANVAARLQSAARPGTVLISADTCRLVSSLFEVESRGLLEMKGKAEPMEVFEVAAARAERGKARGIEGLSSPLVGRSAELERLRAVLGGLNEGRGAVVAVTGEAGVGKSRLVEELERAARSEPAVVWHEGHALSYGQSLAYHPWQELGRRLVGALPAEGPEAVRGKLAAEAVRLERPADDIPFFETMLAVESAESREALASVRVSTLAERVADAVRGFLQAAMHHGDDVAPHVLAFDDLQWADTASLELIQRVAHLVRSEPLLLLFVLRPERRAPGWAVLEQLESLGERFVRLELEPLDADGADELLRNLLDIHDLPDGMRELILSRSEGNPLFVEEVLRSLIDSGHIVRENGDWHASAEIEEATIPETLAGVLSARIDGLPETTKRVAQTASVLGRTFAHRALSSVLRVAPEPERIEDVDPHLGTLTAEDVVREESIEPEHEYIFKHIMTQEAAYGLLLKSRRRELHARAGTVLEELYPDRLEELAPILAHHFHEGGDPVRTARYAVRAGERATALFAVREALDHYEQAYTALDAMDDPPAGPLVDVILGWTVARSKVHDYDGALERLERAESLARELDDRRRLARVVSWIANVHMLIGAASSGAPYLVEAQQLATELDDERLNLLPLFIATDMLVEHDPRGAADRMTHVIELSRRYNVPEIEGHALASKAAAHARLGEFDTAREYIDKALQVAPLSGSPVKEADVHIIVGFAYYDLGDVDKGLEHLRFGANMASGVDAIECACIGHFGVGMGDLMLDAADDAARDFQESMAYADRADIGSWRNRVRGGAALADFVRGHADAVQELEAALANANKAHDGYGSALLSQQLAAVLLGLDRAEEAVSHLETALAYYRDTDMKPAEARTLDSLADALDARGDQQSAAESREAAAALHASLPNP